MLARLRIVLGLSVCMALPTVTHAVTLGSIEVKSAVNEPFRAKIPLSNINVPLSDIKTEVASDNDFARLGLDKNASPNVKFRIQDNGNGTAVLWLSSDEPVDYSQVDLLISVDNERDRTLHQMSAALQPARQLTVQQSMPPTMQTNNSVESEEIPLIPIEVAPPPLTTSAPKIELPKVVEAPEYTAKPVPSVAVNTPAVLDETPTVVVNAALPDEPTYEQEKNVTPDSNQPASTKPLTSSQNITTKPKKHVAANTARTSYRVVRRDTLWGIANRLAKQHNMPINKVMASIQAINKNAFAKRNPNLLRSGVTLTIPRYDEVNELARNFKKSKKKASKKAYRASKPVKRKSYKAARKAAAKKNRTVRSVRKTTKRLRRAEMFIVTPAKRGVAQGEVKAAKKSTRKSLSPQIKTQLRKSRMATVEHRKRINKLNTKLGGYSKQIKLQNAKLAELESRLKELKNKRKSQPTG